MTKTPSLQSDTATDRLRVGGDARLAGVLARVVGPGEVAWATTVVPGWVRIVLAATSAGVCRLELLEDDGVDAAVLRIRQDFPDATLRRDDDGLDPLLATASGYLVRRDAAALRLPIDVGGTPFQREVWNALLTIPPGKPMTYGQVAQALGRPGGSSARAVGSACGANRVALAIPCHRVIGEGGKLTGYRWGTALKSRLLETERARRKERESSPGVRLGRSRC